MIWFDFMIDFYYGAINTLKRFEHQKEWKSTFSFIFRLFAGYFENVLERRVK